MLRWLEVPTVPTILRTALTIPLIRTLRIVLRIIRRQTTIIHLFGTGKKAIAFSILIMMILITRKILIILTAARTILRTPLIIRALTTRMALTAIALTTALTTAMTTLNWLRLKEEAILLTPVTTLIRVTTLILVVTTLILLVTTLLQAMVNTHTQTMMNHA